MQVKDELLFLAHEGESLILILNGETPELKLLKCSAGWFISRLAFYCLNLTGVGAFRLFVPIMLLGDGGNWFLAFVSIILIWSTMVRFFFVIIGTLYIFLLIFCFKIGPFINLSSEWSGLSMMAVFSWIVSLPRGLFRVKFESVPVIFCSMLDFLSSWGRSAGVVMISPWGVVIGVTFEPWSAHPGMLTKFLLSFFYLTIISFLVALGPKLLNSLLSLLILTSIFLVRLRVVYFFIIRACTFWAFSVWDWIS